MGLTIIGKYSRLMSADLGGMVSGNGNGESPSFLPYSPKTGWLTPGGGFEGFSHARQPSEPTSTPSARTPERFSITEKNVFLPVVQNPGPRILGRLIVQHHTWPSPKAWQVTSTS